MNIPADTLSEQLSAFMDGELPEAEARFLQRRLEHDAELRLKWARLQLAASCLKGQPLRLMTDDLPAAVSAGIGATVEARTRRPLLRWAMAASVVGLAVLMAPRLLQMGSPQPVATTASIAAPSADHILASPSSADLVAERTPISAGPAPATAISAVSVSSDRDFIKRNQAASAKSSPMPLSQSSPTDFPLLDGGEKRSWPRSELIGAQNDPSLEAYLVRHNQMLSDEGMGGFVPYVDVVASDPSATASDPDASTQDAGASQQ
jgi:hypothetical protein